MVAVQDGRGRYQHDTRGGDPALHSRPVLCDVTTALAPTIEGRRSPAQRESYCGQRCLGTVARPTSAPP